MASTSLLPRDKMLPGTGPGYRKLADRAEAVNLATTIPYHHSARQLLVLEHQLTWNRDIGPEGLCASVQDRKSVV